VWHINADEPRILDYNEEFNPPSLYDPGPFRASDHDPVVIHILPTVRVYVPVVFKGFGGP
jgi:predicted extracellular nuclease